MTNPQSRIYAAIPRLVNGHRILIGSQYPMPSPELRLSLPLTLLKIIHPSGVIRVTLQRVNGHGFDPQFPVHAPGLLFNNGDPSVPAFPFKGVPDRILTPNEDFDEFGRLIQTMGTSDQNGLNNHAA